MCDRKLQAWKFRVDSEDHSVQAIAGDDGCTLALKPTRIVNRSPKQRVPVAPKNHHHGTRGLTPAHNFLCG